MKLRRRQLLLTVTFGLIWALLFSVACLPTSSATPTGEEIQQIQTAVETRQITAVPSPSATTTLTLAISEVKTPVVPTETPSPLPTSTAEPGQILTPPGNSAEEQVLWLYETNNGCQLPCWWGIVPGETDWQTARAFLRRFDQDIYRNDLPSGEIFFAVDVPLPTEVFSENRTELGILVANDVVQGMQAAVSIGDTPPGFLELYTLSTFLTAYGQPSEVWLSTYHKPFENDSLPFDMLLFYPQQGIMALFNDNAILDGSLVKGCPQQDPVRVVSLWSPALGWTFDKVKNDSSAYNVDYLRLEDTTDWDTTTFYETFKNPDNTTCIETEAELWRYIQ